MYFNQLSEEDLESNNIEIIGIGLAVPILLEGTVCICNHGNLVMTGTDLRI